MVTPGASASRALGSALSSICSVMRQKPREPTWAGASKTATRIPVASVPGALPVISMVASGSAPTASSAAAIELPGASVPGPNRLAS